MQSGERLVAVAAMWDMAAEQCAARLAAEPNTKELRDLVYIAETLQSMAAKADKAAEAATLVVVFEDPLAEAWAE